VSEGAREATHTYIAIEESGRYRVMGETTLTTKDVTLLPVPPDDREHWLEIDSVPGDAARAALGALLDRANSKGWHWALRVRPERGVGLAMRDPVRVVVGSDGAVALPHPLGPGDPVTLELHGGSLPAELDAAYQLAATGCTVTLSSASSPASRPAPAAP